MAGNSKSGRRNFPSARFRSNGRPIWTRNHLSFGPEMHHFLVPEWSTFGVQNDADFVSKWSQFRYHFGPRSGPKCITFGSQNGRHLESKMAQISHQNGVDFGVILDPNLVHLGSQNGSHFGQEMDQIGGRTAVCLRTEMAQGRRRVGVPRPVPSSGFLFGPHPVFGLRGTYLEKRRGAVL